MHLVGPHHFRPFGPHHFRPSHFLLLSEEGPSSPIGGTAPTPRRHLRPALPSPFSGISDKLPRDLVELIFRGRFARYTRANLPPGKKSSGSASNNVPVTARRGETACRPMQRAGRVEQARPPSLPSRDAGQGPFYGAHQRPRRPVTYAIDLMKTCHLRHRHRLSESMA